MERLELLKLKTIEYEIDKTSPIYGDIYKWICSEHKSFPDEIHTLHDEFIRGNLRLDVFYNQCANTAERGMDWLQTIFDSIHSKPHIPTPLKLKLYTSMLEYLYNNVQRDIFKANVILNKVLFEKKIISSWEYINKESNISFLEYLTVLDHNTKNKYIANAPNYHSLYHEYFSEKCVKLVSTNIQELSEQKKWEKYFETLNQQKFSPLLIKLRNEVHKILDSINMMPLTEEEQYCIWLLLPYIKGIEI